MLLYGRQGDGYARNCRNRDGVVPGRNGATDHNELYLRLCTSRLGDKGVGYRYMDSTPNFGVFLPAYALIMFC